MAFTPDQLRQLGYSLQPDGSYSKSATTTQPKRKNAKFANSGAKNAFPTNEADTQKLPDPITEPAARKTLVRAGSGKEKGSSRIVVRITRVSSRPLDADNYAGGCKPLIDQLRYAKLIPDDDPASVELIFLQRVEPKGNSVEVEIFQEK
jgi:hypothetical protein